MFWKKSAKSSDLTISGKFSLGVANSTTPQEGSALKGGIPPLNPSNSDDSLAPESRVLSQESSQGSSQGRIQGSDLSPICAQTKATVALRDGVPRYVVPQGYKVSSSTFVQGLVRVDGELGGRGVTASAVAISPGGVVSAPLEAGSLRISGQLNASAEVRGCIEVCASAEVFGPIVSAELVVEPGARVASSRLQVG